MRYELKITLPIYKIVYSIAFMVIIVLVSPINSFSGIITAVEPNVALLTELVSNAENHVFRCSFQNERDFQEFQRNYKVTSKIYKANEIEVRFVNGRKPEFLCELCTPNLEDAYIYNMYVKEND